jgi:hypothetical protein
MAEDKLEQREFNFRQTFPWTELFQGFRVALDPKKLLLAAAGILVMALGWYVLAWLFASVQSKPQPTDPTYTAILDKDSNSAAARQRAWQRFREDRTKWSILWEHAGDDSDRYTDAGDLARSLDEYEAKTTEDKSFPDFIKDEIKTMRPEERQRTVTFQAVGFPPQTYTIQAKPYGQLRTLPFFEDRGENPYLLVTNQTPIKAEPGRLGEWFLRRELPVLIEPLRKFMLPVLGLLTPGSGLLNSIYFLLVIVWTLAVWGLFGGAITRMASIQVARGEKISMREALSFVRARYVSFLSAPLIPLIFVGFMVFLLSLYGLVFMIPWLGDIFVAGLGWPLVLLSGLLMAVVLVGLVGWPMMYATISAEGSDSFDAISRSYSYVYQSPWSYAWYSLVALAYGAVVVFFVGFMGSMVVYLGKWGVSQTPFIQKAGRDPSFLFVYAPTSFGWRDLLLDGARVDGQAVVQNGQINPTVYKQYYDQLGLANKAGAFLVAVWMYLMFLMIVGFGYSYFWSASTILYLLMRRKVDDTDLDEIYLEEDEIEEPYSATTGLAAAPSPTPAGTQQVTLVPAPTLRTTPPPPAPTAPPDAEKPAESPVPTGTDDKPPVDGGGAPTP